ncbi:MAG: DUF2177 family protein [Bacteroidota bacterium]
MIKKYILLYLLAAIVFFSIDMVWLGILAQDFYENHIGFVLSDEVNWMAAAAFYLIYLSGILYFAIIPNFKQGNWKGALVQGAMFGFFCYATYDLTNMATIIEWPLIVVVVDLTWGTFLTGSTAVLTHILGAKFLNF